MERKLEKADEVEVELYLVFVMGRGSGGEIEKVSGCGSCYENSKMYKKGIREGILIGKREHFQDLSVYICRRVWDNKMGFRINYIINLKLEAI